ncbi:MAG: sialate O-acetylesterase [Flavicella sp.]
MKKFWLNTLFTIFMSTMNAQSIEILTFGENPLLLDTTKGGTVTVRYKYSSEFGATSNHVYVALELLNGNNQPVATIAQKSLSDQQAGIDIIGIMTLEIKGDVTPSKDLSNNYYYQLKASLHKSNTWQSLVMTGYWNVPKLFIEAVDETVHDIAIHTKIDVLEGLKLLSEKGDYGVIASGNGTIRVEVFDKYVYDRVIGNNAFLYGFKSEGDTHKTYNNQSFGLIDRNNWNCYGVDDEKDCSHFYYTANFIDAESNDMRLLKKALYMRNKFVSPKNPSFSRIGGTLDIVLKITLTKGASLEDIESIKIPGLAIWHPKKYFNSFKKIAFIGNCGYQGENGSKRVSNFIRDNVQPDAIVSAGNDSYKRGGEPLYKDDFYYNSMLSIDKYHSVLGNLDYATTNGEADWLAIFRSGVASPKLHYKYSIGDIDFFMLNTNNREGLHLGLIPETEVTKTKNWLMNELSASDKKYKIVVGHHAAFQSGQNSNVLKELNFKELGADMYLSAGGAFYERHDVDGVPHVNIGLGGMYIDETKHPEQDEYVPDTHYSDNFGVLTATETQQSLRFEFLNIEGDKKDEFYLTGWRNNYYNKRGAPLKNRNAALDLFLVLGQSNATGRCPGNLCWKFDKGFPQGDDLMIQYPDELGVLDEVYLLNDLGEFEEATYGFARYSSVEKIPFMAGLGIGWTFASTISSTRGIKTGMIVNSRGGTTMENWQKDHNVTTKEQQLYGMYSYGYQGGSLYEEFERRVHSTLQIYPNAKLKGVLWLHGESDATNINNNTLDYSVELSKFIKSLRTDFSLPNLPFLIAEVTYRDPDRKEWGHIKVNEEIHQTASENDNVYVISVEGLNTFDGKPENHDIGIHWNHESYRELGVRFANTWLENHHDTSHRNHTKENQKNTEHFENEFVKVYPNPSESGQFKILIEKLVYGPIDVAIRTIQGNVYFEKTMYIENGTHEINVQLDSKLKTGIYTVEVNSDQITSHSMLVIK